MINHSSRPGPAQTKYANLLSRLLLKARFERQFVIPLEPPPKLIETLMIWYERFLLDVDTSRIPIDRPIFVVGMPRSGTTTLEDVICAHPGVAYITNTMHQFRKCFCAVETMRRLLQLDFVGERYVYDGVKVGPGSPNEGHMFLADWRRVDPFSLEHVEYQPEQSTPEDIERMRATIRKIIWCFGTPPRRFCNKSPNLIGYVALLPQLFPDVKIIHIVRDARMVANSMLKLYARHRDQERKIRALQGKATGDDHPFFVPYPRLPKLAEYVRTYGADDIRTTAHMWNDAMTSVGQWKEQLPHFYEVRYEDIVADPRGEIQKLCDFAEFEPIADRQSPFWRKVDTIRPQPRYPEYGSFDIVEAICRDPMRRYGYLS